MSLDAQVKAKIEEQIKSDRIFLYMKGNPQVPMCGFSAQVVHILGQVGQEYSSFNILEDEAIRAGIKEYSDWPTIPQLYVDGEFVGGCDIITEMFQSGELKKLLQPEA